MVGAPDRVWCLRLHVSEAELGTFRTEEEVVRGIAAEEGKRKENELQLAGWPVRRRWAFLLQATANDLYRSAADEGCDVIVHLEETLDTLTAKCSTLAVGYRVPVHTDGLIRRPW